MPLGNMSTSFRPSSISPLILTFYGIMALSGLGLTIWRRDAWQIDPLTVPGEAPLAHLAATVATVLLVCGGSKLWLATSARARRCARMVVDTLQLRRRRQILWLALLSGLGEELLFRGWLLHDSGLWISSLMFGLIHIPPNRDWWFWPIFATAVGLVFGLLTLTSGTILWAVLAHAGINYLNLNQALSGSGIPAMGRPHR